MVLSASKLCLCMVRAAQLAVLQAAASSTGQYPWGACFGTIALWTFRMHVTPPLCSPPLLARPACSDGLKYAADLKDLLLTATPGKVAGFMAETIQGVGGAVPLASGYLPEVYKVRA